MKSLEKRVVVKIDGTNELMTLQELISRVDKEACSLYKCYRDNGLKKQQRMAIRSSYKFEHIYELTESSMALYKEMLTNEESVSERISGTYLKWLLIYMKASCVSMPKTGAYMKKHNYTTRCVGKELVDAALYQIMNSNISKAACLSLKGDNGIGSDSHLFKVNDLKYDSVEDYINWFKTRPGYSLWESWRVGNEERYYRFVVPMSSDGLYRMSNGYFK